MIAGGVESMTRAPYVLPKSDAAFGRQQHLFDTVLGWRMVNPRCRKSGRSRWERRRRRSRELYGVAREEQDRFAFESQMKCKAAMERGRFADEIVPVSMPDAKGAAKLVERDEHPRPETTRRSARCAQARIQDRRNGDRGQLVGHQRRRVGAAALRVRGRARDWGCAPIARFAWLRQSPASLPTSWGWGRFPRRARRSRAPASPSPISISSRSTRPSPHKPLLACANSRSMPAQTNVNGGAIALGHPLGASGARIATTLLTSCGGARAATVWRRCASASARESQRFSSASS